MDFSCKEIISGDNPFMYAHFSFEIKEPFISAFWYLIYEVLVMKNTMPKKIQAITNMGSKEENIIDILYYGSAKEIFKEFMEINRNLIGEHIL